MDAFKDDLARNRFGTVGAPGAKDWTPVWIGAAIVSVVALSALAMVDSWSPEAWTALAAWVTATIASAAGVIAVRQLREARRLRVEQAQPYVAAFMEPSGGVDAGFVDLVVRNFGTTSAMNVRVEIDPAPQRAAGGSVQAVWLPDGIPVLVPGQEWRTLWDFAPRRAKVGLADRHDVAVLFTDTEGRELRLPYVLDWSVYSEQMQVTIYGVHHAAKALRGIEKKLGKWQEGIHGGLAVTMRDGDAKDARRREEIDGLQRSQPLEPEGDGNEEPR